MADSTSKTADRPDHPLVVDSETKLCRLATQADIFKFERIAIKYEQLRSTLKELTDD